MSYIRISGFQLVSAVFAGALLLAAACGGGGEGSPDATVDATTADGAGTLPDATPLHDAMPPDGMPPDA